ncbi:MAG: thioredoxin family protein, partial [Bacilli bacterium]|nr:thioredoxin family protein [Bacilli bacterium]
MISKLKGWVIGLIVLFILMIPIISNYYKSKDIEIINYNDYLTLLEDFDFTLLYVTDEINESYSDTKETLLNARNNFDIRVKTLSTSKLSQSEKDELLNNHLTKEFNKGYVFMKDSKVVHVEENDITNETLEKLINKYYNNVIPEEEIAYKVPANYKEFKKIVDSKKVNMFVFGRETCGWCNLYKPIYNDIAAEYKLDIYDFDSDNYDSSELSKVRNSGLIIPGACTDSGENQPLSEGYSTPLTLFTKNGKVIDC